MVNFQIGSSIYPISLMLIISLIIATTAALDMIKKKRINIFIPFFVLGLGVCLTAAFMLYDFFGVAVDVFYVFSFVSVVGIFFILWGQGK